MMLTLGALVSMTPIVNGQDVVRLAARHVLLCQVKGQPSVRDAFFAGSEVDQVDGVDGSTSSVHSPQSSGPSPLTSEYEAAAMTSWFDFGRYSVLLAAQAISKTKDEYRIHLMLDEQLIDEQLRAIHDSSDWKKIGFTLYTTLFSDLVKDETTRVTFRNYVDKEPRKWAHHLCEMIRDQRMVEAWLVKPLASGTMTQEQVDREVNIFFVKLHLLDPTAVLPAFQLLMKVLPNLSLHLATTNYLGGPLEWTLIRNEVEAAILRPSYATNVRRPSLSTDPLEYYCGVRVTEFIMLECRELGLWTGAYPDNGRVSHMRDRCRIM